MSGPTSTLSGKSSSKKNSKPLLCIRAPVFHSFWICIGLHPKIFPSLGPLEMLRFLWAPSVAARPLSVGYEWLMLSVPEMYTHIIFTLLIAYIIFMFKHPWRKEWTLVKCVRPAMYNGNNWDKFEQMRGDFRQGGTVTWRAKQQHHVTALSAPTPTATGRVALTALATLKPSAGRGRRGFQRLQKTKNFVWRSTCEPTSLYFQQLI